MDDYRPPLFSFNGSMSRVFGVEVFGRQDNAWWHRAFIKPVWRVGYRLREWQYEILYRVHPGHQYHLVRTGLKPGYYDADYLMLHACFALLCRYVEDENDGLEAIERWGAELMTEPDTNAPEGLQASQGARESEAAALYRWWKEKRPADIAERGRLVSHLYGRPYSLKKDENGMSVYSTDQEWTEEDGALRKVLWELEETIDREEQEMLHRLIDIRGGLWT